MISRACFLVFNGRFGGRDKSSHRNLELSSEVSNNHMTTVVVEYSWPAVWGLFGSAAATLGCLPELYYILVAYLLFTTLHHFASQYFDTERYRRCTYPSTRRHEQDNRVTSPSVLLRNRGKACKYETRSTELDRGIVHWHRDTQLETGSTCTQAR